MIACIKPFCHSCSKPQRGFFVLRNLETKAGATIPLHTQLHPADQAGPTIAPMSVKQNFPALDAPSHYSHRGLAPRSFSNWVLPQLQDPLPWEVSLELCPLPLLPKAPPEHPPPRGLPLHHLHPTNIVKLTVPQQKSSGISEKGIFEQYSLQEQ